MYRYLIRDLLYLHEEGEVLYLRCPFQAQISAGKRVAGANITEGVGFLQLSSDNKFLYIAKILLQDAFHSSLSSPLYAAKLTDKASECSVLHLFMQRTRRTLTTRNLHIPVYFSGSVLIFFSREGAARAEEHKKHFREQHVYSNKILKIVFQICEGDM